MARDRWVTDLVATLEKEYGRPLRPGELAAACANGRVPYAEVEGPNGEIRIMERASVYLAFYGEPDRADFLKVGVARSVRSRIQSHRTSNPLHNTLTLSAVFNDRRTAEKVEGALLNHMVADKQHGEWVRCKASVDACRAIAQSLAEVASQVCGKPVEFTE